MADYRKATASALTNGQRRPTINDVAALAGVSKSTAARALADNGNVSRDVRRRVHAAAAELKYVVDVNARNLRAGSRREVGVLITNLRDSFYAELATGIQSTLAASGYNMMLANDFGDQDQELRAAETFAALRLPGVILTPVSNAAVQILVNSDIAVVQADRVVDDVVTDAVLSANEKGAHEATKHLLAHGHRHVLLLIDEVVWTTGAGRLEGFRSALHAASIPADDDLISFSSTDAAAARQQVASKLDAHPEISAILAANSVLAEAAFTEIQARGLSQQISLVAYDDAPWMSMIRPTMTTVSQHADEIGRCAAELLIKRMEATTERPPITMHVNPTLITRQSVQHLAPRHIE